MVSDNSNGGRPSSPANFCNFFAQQGFSSVFDSSAWLFTLKVIPTISSKNVLPQRPLLHNIRQRPLRMLFIRPLVDTIDQDSPSPCSRFDGGNFLRTPLISYITFRLYGSNP